MEATEGRRRRGRRGGDGEDGGRRELSTTEERRNGEVVRGIQDPIRTGTTAELIPSVPPFLCG
jgi:hypothetical protein